MKRIIGTLALTVVLASSTTLFAQERDESPIDRVEEPVKMIPLEKKQEANIEKANVIGDEGMLELSIEYVDGVAYMPLRDTLETLGYTVTWNGEKRSIDIQQGAIYTSVILEKNRYFKHRMAPWALSGAPILIDDSTYVPVEFFADILNIAESVEDGILTLDTGEWGSERGYIKSITYTEDGEMRLVISEDLDAEDVAEVIVNTKVSQTIIQKDIQEGDHITAITLPYNTMIYPKTIMAYVIY